MKYCKNFIACIFTLAVLQLLFKHPSLPVRSGGEYAQGDGQTECSRSLFFLLSILIFINNAKLNWKS
jgi:hypothetical protein